MASIRLSPLAPLLTGNNNTLMLGSLLKDAIRESKFFRESRFRKGISFSLKAREITASTSFHSENNSAL